MANNHLKRKKLSRKKSSRSRRTKSTAPIREENHHSRLALIAIPEDWNDFTPQKTASRLGWKDVSTMLLKWLLHAHSLSPYTLLVVIALMSTGCFSIWLLNPSPAISLRIAEEVSSPSHNLLLPENTSLLLHQQSIQQPYTIKEPPSNDETTLIDINNFRFTINHDPCNKRQPLLLIVIHSAPDNFQKRNVIRETWGRPNHKIILLFVIGWSDEYQSRLIEEDRKYMDIIQGNFLDAYRNMTYKHVMTLKWATYYCFSAKHILKLDDDVFVHIPAMIDFLNRGPSPLVARRSLLCDVREKSEVIRSSGIKWRVSPLEYSGKTYPTYCAGWAILYSPDSVFILYREAQKEPYFWIDDVHVTGTLARKLNLTHISFSSWVLTNNDVDELLKNPDEKKKFLLGPLNLTERNIKALYNLTVTGATYK